MSVPPLAEREKPGLSETLPGPRVPGWCQSCSKGPDEAFSRWIECDAWDKPTRVVVVLCAECAEKLIERHARLYHRLWPFDPWPGCMPLCFTCKHRNGTSCAHPDLKANGGKGLAIMVPQGVSTHFNYGRGRGEFRTIRSNWPTECAGHVDRDA